MSSSKGNLQDRKLELDSKARILSKSKKDVIAQLRDIENAIIKKTHGNLDVWAENLEKEINVTTDAAAQAKPKSKFKQKSKSKPKPMKNKAVEATTPVTIEELKGEEGSGRELEGEEGSGRGEVKTIRPEDCLKSIYVRYCIKNYQGGVLYEGTKNSKIFSNSRSFIEAKQSQIDNIDDLIEIGSNSRYIVTTEDLIDGVEILPMLVTEPVVSVTSFFEVEAKSFICENNLDDGDRSRWWALISDRFKCIFGNVVHGLIYLHSFGHICGDLINHIYVSAKGEGKILPLMDKKKNEDYDISNLTKKMKEIITLPFPETEVDETYTLPDELSHFLEFVTADKLKHIPLYWLVNHPYFWSSPERINFVVGFKILLRQEVIYAMDVNSFLLKYGSYSSQDSLMIDWSRMIDKGVCDGLFKRIYDRPKSVNVNAVKKYDTCRPCEIVRYSCNCYNHANDHEYRITGTPQAHYSPHEIEASLRSFFPMIYVDLYIVLYLFRSTVHSGNSKTQIFKAFENWSSSYFAPKTLAASTDEGKQNFQLVQAGSFVAKTVSSSVSIFNLSPSLRALARCAKELKDRQIIIPVKKEVMNQIQNLYFGQDQIIPLPQKDKLDVTHISTYIRLLHEDCVNDELTKTFGFLCPSRISSSIESKDEKLIQRNRAERSHYIVDALRDDEASSNEKLYLAPYNIMDHWILCLIDPYASIVYYLDPLSGKGREVGQDLCNVVDTALRSYLNQHNRTITWRKIQCPQQDNMVDCGYYVLRFMREVVTHRLIDIPDDYFDDCAWSTYDQTQINEVRDELACEALRFYAEVEPKCA